MKEDSHSRDKFIIHASHIKKKKRLQPNFQSLLLNFKIYNFVTKKLFFGKKSDLYLMKIQISFCVKKIKFENTDHILS